MSLVIWLPLDGDLRNQGCSNLTITNTNATINNTGKIGKCYNFAKNAYLDINKEIMTSFSEAVSICFWVKINSWNTNWDTIFQAGTGSTPWTAYKIGILRNSANYLCFTLSNASSSSQSSYRTGDLTLNQWMHVTCVYSTGKCQTYLNGVLSNSYSTTYIPDFSGITSIKIGGLTSNYKCDCDLNDFRIYDHCLSAAEVHEIAQGLVLHYKLDNIEIKNGTNLVTGVTKGRHTTLLTDGRIGVQTTGENADTYFTINLSENITNGTSYFLSCDASGITSEKFWNFPLGTQSNTSLLFRIHSGHNEIMFTANDINWGTNRLFMDDVNREDWANLAQFYNFQLIKIGSAGAELEVKDNSGYGHNGTIVGTAIINNSTPRYFQSLSMNNTSSSNHIEVNDILSLSDMTVSFWLKSVKSTNQVIFADITNTIEFGTLNSLGYINTNTTAGWTLNNFINNEWNHIIIKKQDSTYQLYVNGVLENQNGANNNYVHQNSKMWLLNRSYNNNYGANASISDFRIYCTPLLDTDIKLLYNVGMRVDNLQNLHTFEYKENTSNLFRSELIMPWAKANRTRIGEIVEHNNTYALNIAPEPFYKNIDSSTSGALNGSFATNTSYIFDMWVDTDSVIYNNNNVAGGMTIRYSDNSTDNTFVFTGGNKGYQHKVLITPSNKTVQRLEFYYYTSTDVFYRIDSCICPLSDLKLKKTGIFEGTNLLEETNTKLIKNALIETNQIIEL